MFISAVVMFVSLYNFSYVIRKGPAHGIHANRNSICILILHGVLAVIVIVSLTSIFYLEDELSVLLANAVFNFGIIVTNCSMLIVLNKMSQNSNKAT